MMSDKRDSLSFEELVRVYGGQAYTAVEICGMRRELPIRRVAEDIWIASNHQLVLGRDVEFTRRVGARLAEMIKVHNPEFLLTAESKSLPLVYETAKRLGHLVMGVARKEKKSYMGKTCLAEKIRSITTGRLQNLVLEMDEAEKMRGKRVCVIDDVVSTYGTMGGLERLAERAGGKVVCRAAVWLEGPWYGGDLMHLGILPIFVTREKFDELRRAYG
ncbi:MAG: hypothetical protein APU95_06135 [Hadesarchaea archaeon YNP_N21]|nr:MAG: hypothetical protein APU95_06135 [Hadesarchaea archaeon YNP_N21]